MKYILFSALLLLLGTAKGQIKFLKDYGSINNISELFNRFKGRAFLIDLWAPWCEPCKDEFKYSNTLYKELHKRKIELVYLSLYTRVEETDWRSDIDKYHLNGIHILANKNLENTITTMIWGAPGGFSIPRYLLIGRDGQVLLNDALSPEHGIQLYNQIDSAMLKGRR